MPRGWRAFVLLVFAALAVLPLVANQYLLFVSNLALIYIVLVLGLNLLVGYAGLLGFAHAALFGIGAYAAGLAQVRLGVPYFLALPLGGVAAAAIGTVCAVPALRLRGMSLALLTLAFAQVTTWCFVQFDAVTFGAGGFPVPKPSFAPLPLDPTHGVYALSWVCAGLLLLGARGIVASRLGRAFAAMRDSEPAAETLGIDLLRHKALAFGLSGFYAGIAGGLYAALLGFVAPESFDLFQMIVQKAMAVVGGTASVAGAVLGATLLVYAMEALRPFQSLQEIAFGALLLGFVLLQPEGLVALIRRRFPSWHEDLNGAPAPASLPPLVARPVGSTADP